MLPACKSFRRSLNITKLAEKTIVSLGYWFRTKYNLPPKDPRYLNMEPWELELEYEITERLEREKRRSTISHTCSNCDKVFMGDTCPYCGAPTEGSTVREYYWDPDYLDYEKAVLKENENFFNNLKWVDVKDDEIE